MGTKNNNNNINELIYKTEITPPTHTHQQLIGAQGGNKLGGISGGNKLGVWH